MVRKHLVNGKTLINLQKIEKLFTPELTTANILPYLKMIMIIQEIRGSDLFASHVSLPDQTNDRPRPRSMMID
jgi:hypothetical protein